MFLDTMRLHKRDAIGPELTQFAQIHLVPLVLAGVDRLHIYEARTHRFAFERVALGHVGEDL